ncbi:MAG TPA: hypothetical protein VK815_12560 [Candidatus Acidoferrales bacterium]|jgi:hypothetical protein|nr:hypothetical protein [Candidatus Acidoferrales bacterium]
MNARVKKILLLLLAAVLVFSSGQIQKSLNVDRDRLGLTHAAVLENAPPLLAFTTVALGGFRGLISNFLWMRASDLQQDDKFFEASQLATWITDLEPHFSQVWVFQGWNMSYNISVKFKENAPGDYTDRWRWVQRGIELMRDEGLKYNPDDVLIYRELAWQFQHKIGANLDDGNMFYKMMWSEQMTNLFGPEGTNYESLVSPQTDADRANAQAIREKFKLDPAFIKVVDQEHGPLDWRLPEAHAIYWGEKGLEQAKLHPDKVKQDDLIMLRRIVYQSIYQAFKHGRIAVNPFNGRVTLAPNLELVGRVNDTYEQSAAEDSGNRDNILRAQRNFLRDAIYFLYENNRMKDAAKWFKVLGDKFPDKPIVENDPTSLPKNLTLDEYAVAVIQIDIGETSQERVTSAVQGLLVHAYLSLVQDDDASYQNYRNLATRVYDKYTKATAGYNNNNRIALMPFPELNTQVVRDLLDTQRGLPPDARAILRSRLGLPAEVAAQATTNAVPLVPTNGTPAATNEPAPAIP